MSANPEGPVERAMTHDGHSQWCARPAEARAIAGRLMAWRDAPQSCQNCMSATATRIVVGLALCVRCREQRSARMEDLRRIEPVGNEWRGTVPKSNRVVEGHAIVTNSLSVDLGGFRERIMPEALTRVLRTDADLVYLWNHNTNIPLTRMSAGKMAIRKDDFGLMIRVEMPTSAVAEFDRIQDRTVNGQSFGFRALEDEWFMDSELPVRHVTDMTVSEASAVVFPAYTATTVKVAHPRDDRYFRMRMAR